MPAPSLFSTSQLIFQSMIFLDDLIGIILAIKRLRQEIPTLDSNNCEHGVRSSAMTWMFLYPLLGGVFEVLSVIAII